MTTSPPPLVRTVTPPPIQQAENVTADFVVTVILAGAVLLTLTALGFVRLMRNFSVARRAIFAALAAFLLWSSFILIGGLDWALTLIVCAMLGIPAVVAGAFVYFRELGRESTTDYTPPPPIDWRGHFETTVGLAVASPLIAAGLAIMYSVLTWLGKAKWPDISVGAFFGHVKTDWVGFNKIANEVLNLHIAFLLFALFFALLWGADEWERSNGKNKKT